MTRVFFSKLSVLAIGALCAVALMKRGLAPKARKIKGFRSGFLHPGGDPSDLEGSGQ